MFTSQNKTWNQLEDDIWNKQIWHFKLKFLSIFMDTTNLFIRTGYK